jgi:hypothetical protein
MLCPVGVLDRRYAEAGAIGGPMMLGTWLELFESETGEETRLLPLAFAMAVLWSDGHGGCWEVKLGALWL